MKTIIIPFSNSTNLLGLTETIASVLGTETIQCIFLSIRPLPDNYNDLFFLSNATFATLAASQSFYNFSAACKNQFDNRVSITADYIYGDSAAVFRNYAQHKNADMVVFDTAQWEFINKKQRAGIFKMLCRSGCELLYVAPGNTFVARARDTDTPRIFWEKELGAVPSTNRNEAGSRTAVLPRTVVYQYRAVDDMLNEFENNVAGKDIFSKKLGLMSRYFLKEIAIQKMLDQSHCSFVLLKKSA